MGNGAWQVNPDLIGCVGPRSTGLEQGLRGWFGGGAVLDTSQLWCLRHLGLENCLDEGLPHSIT